MLNKGYELAELCKEKNKKISEIILEKEMKTRQMSYQDLMAEMKNILDTMMSSAQAALNKEVISVSGLTGGNAKRMEDYRKRGKTVSGDLLNSAMAMAFSTSEVNASMGKIAAAPTAGASGIIPAALIIVKERFNLTNEEIIYGLFTAGGIGEIIAKNATVSGAEGGCQAECGVASAMAAAAIVELVGGDADTSLHAASIAIINIMGLICDPVAGLVEFPCALRNASGVNNALISADMALAGIQSIIPFDQVVEAMYKVGKAMPESLRETALGGIAATLKGEEYKEKLS